MPSTRKLPVECAYCGETFMASTDHIKRGAKYCSPRCVGAARKTTWVDLVCAYCQKPYQLALGVYNARVSAGKPPTYCSVACAHAAPEWKANMSQAQRESEAAQTARAQATPRLIDWAQSEEGRQARRESRAAQMADPEQRARWEAGIERRSQSEEWRSAPHFQRGEAHPRWEGGKSRERLKAISRYEYKAWRTAVFQRDNYTCQDCGQRGGRLHAHHIVGWAVSVELRYEVSNGLTLCEPCHNARHGRPSGPLHFDRIE